MQVFNSFQEMQAGATVGGAISSISVFNYNITPGDAQRKLDDMTTTIHSIATSVSRSSDEYGVSGEQHDVIISATQDALDRLSDLSTALKGLTPDYRRRNAYKR